MPRSFNGLLLDRTPIPAGETPHPFAGIDFSATQPVIPFGGDQTWVQANAMLRRNQMQNAQKLADEKARTTPGVMYRNPKAAPLIAGLFDRVQARPTPLTVTQRSPVVGGGITKLNTVFGEGQDRTNQTIADFTREYLTQKPKAQQFANEEINSISQVYGSGPGSVRDDMKRLMAQRNAAMRTATQEAMNRARRDNSVFRMNNGNSSFADQQYGSVLAQLAAQEAAREADLNREDYLYQRQGQASMLGNRNRILNDLLMRDLMPVEQGQRLMANDAGLLGSIANLENANNIYDYQSPEQGIESELRLLASIMDLENQNTIATPLV